MAVAGFKIAVNHSLRLFQDVPLALYTDIPLAEIKCLPEKSGIEFKGISQETTHLTTQLDHIIRDFLHLIGMEGKTFRFEIKIFTHAGVPSQFELISTSTAICTILNEWLHQPIDKNNLLSWLIEQHGYRDADIIAACMYGGIMSHVGVRPFRIYQPKGLFFYLERISHSQCEVLPPSIVPIFTLSLERSDFNSMHDLLKSIHTEGNIEESYLGVLDLPNLDYRLHIHTVSESANTALKKSSIVSPVFQIDSFGCIVI